MNKTISAALLLTALAACDEVEFPEYNELSGLRVLALRAEPPDLVPGSSTALDALVYHESADDSTLHWTFCPWPGDPNEGFPCLLTDASWQTAWRAAGLSGSAPSFELGRGATAALSVVDERAELRALCRALLSELGATAVAPDCEGTWRWTVRLTTRSGDETIETIKDVRVLLDDDPVPNHNPRLDGLSALRDGDTVSLETLTADEEYELKVDLHRDQSETYLPAPVPGQAPSSVQERREALTFTWFVEGGSTDRVHSTFNVGADEFDAARTNLWQTPTGRSRARVVVVVRDHRGGLGFFDTEVGFEK